MLRLAHTSGMVPATGPLKSLDEGTGCRNSFYEQFTQSILRNKLQGPVPIFQTICGTTMSCMNVVPCSTMNTNGGTEN